MIEAVHYTSKKITGLGIPGAKVKAYVNNKQIGEATVDKKNNYSIAIKKQKLNTKITVKISKS
ncbi:MAG: Ig-like domain-containing protein, partial [Peptostreptococcaceae bacterium]